VGLLRLFNQALVPSGKMLLRSAQSAPSSGSRADGALCRAAFPFVERKAQSPPITVNGAPRTHFVPAIRMLFSRRAHIPEAAWAIRNRHTYKAAFGTVPDNARARFRDDDRSADDLAFLEHEADFERGILHAV
jgi:hypothetical protein